MHPPNFSMQNIAPYPNQFHNPTAMPPFPGNTPMNTPNHYPNLQSPSFQIPFAGEMSTMQQQASYPVQNIQTSYQSESSRLSNPNSNICAVVRLIDFNNWEDAHGQYDHESIKGVQNLINNFRKFL